MLTRPDVLVLGGGGVLGEAWMMGLLAGLEDATGFDMRQCEHFVGTSAGAIVAAHLAAGRAPRRPPSLSDEEANGHDAAISVAQAEGLAAAARAAARQAGAFALAAGATFAPLALGLAAPGGAVLRAAVLSRLPRPEQTLDDLRRRIRRSGAHFDGRLRVVAVDRHRGRRVVFGGPRAPKASVADAVAASCTVPWLFAPVEIGGREYVDGGVWSPANLDAAPAGRDTCVLCLVPTAGMPAQEGALGMIRRISRSATAVETLVLRRRGAAVQLVAPDPGCTEAMGENWMDRARGGRVLAAGYRQGLSLATPRVSAPAPRRRLEP